ncbi:APC family permease [Paeniglutamicibacter sp. R2-26]|uniref:APC family permease n=1 Tax=Paeniglutamicibacter sp. R2-26 TaxID=3144417 RepID=UPI003EE797B5
MPKPAVVNAPGNSLASSAMNLPELVLTALASVAPLTLVAAVMPLHFLIGGNALPGGYIVVGIVMMLFAVGLTTVLKYLRSSGAFYTIIARGLGKPIGTMSAMLAVLAYNALQALTYGLLAIYTADCFVRWFNISLPWWAYGLAVLVVIGFLGLKGITASAKVLGIVLVLEILSLVVLVVAVFTTPSSGPLPLQSFAPTTVFRPESLAMFALIFGAFIGFESTAIYAEEVKGGSRTVRRATYIVVAFVGLFYSLITFAIVTAYGAGDIAGAAEGDLEGLVLNLFERLMNPFVFEIVNILLILSAFAAVLALHNVSNRYVYALGREGMLPRSFGMTHPKTKSPWVASLFQSGLALIVLIGCTAWSVDPYTGLVLVGSAIGFIAIMTLWALCALACIIYLRRTHPEEGVWRTLIAPGLAFMALVVGVILVVGNFHFYSGGVPAVNVLVTIITIVTAGGGLARGLYLRKRRPEIYANLAITVETDGDDIDADAVRHERIPQ